MHAFCPSTTPTIITTTKHSTTTTTATTNPTTTPTTTTTTKPKPPHTTGGRGQLRGPCGRGGGRGWENWCIYVCVTMCVFFLPDIFLFVLFVFLSIIYHAYLFYVFVFLRDAGFGRLREQMMLCSMVLIVFL